MGTPLTAPGGHWGGHPEITPEVAPEVTREVTGEVTHEVTGEVIPEVTGEVTPGGHWEVTGLLLPFCNINVIMIIVITMIYSTRYKSHGISVLVFFGKQNPQNTKSSN